mmetsp:Transcript_7592/g.15768  ORF Transcript_7592/g.15768 Transcript_7592/m.15768 type:complete len:206 (-) Transcript_7592:380-997(-)
MLEPDWWCRPRKALKNPALPPPREWEKRWSKPSSGRDGPNVPRSLSDDGRETGAGRDARGRDGTGSAATAADPPAASPTSVGKTDGLTPSSSLRDGIAVCATAEYGYIQPKHTHDLEDDDTKIYQAVSRRRRRGGKHPHRRLCLRRGPAPAPSSSGAVPAPRRPPSPTSPLTYSGTTSPPFASQPALQTGHDGTLLVHVYRHVQQ